MNCSAFVPKNHSLQVDEVSDSLTSRGGLPVSVVVIMRVKGYTGKAH